MVYHKGYAVMSNTGKNWVGDRSGNLHEDDLLEIGYDMVKNT